MRLHLACVAVSYLFLFDWLQIKCLHAVASTRFDFRVLNICFVLSCAVFLVSWGGVGASLCLDMRRISVGYLLWRLGAAVALSVCSYLDYHAPQGHSITIGLFLLYMFFSYVPS